MSPSVIDRSRLVAECVIAPEMTNLLTAAAKRNRTIHTGVPMLAAQMSLMLAYMSVGASNPNQ
jgi:shikimate dehydrogenase